MTVNVNRRPALVAGFALIVFVLALAGAARVGVGTPLTGRVGDLPEPPFVVLRTADGREQHGARGTYAWDGVVADAFAVIVPPRPIEVGRTEHVTIDASAVGDPTALSYQVLRLSSPPPETAAGALRINPEGCVVRAGELPIDPEVASAIDLPSSNFAVEVVVTLDDGRYTLQGFHLLVREDGAGAASVAAAGPERALPAACSIAFTGVES